MVRIYVYLHVKQGNEAAYQFYIKHKFVLEEEIPQYYSIEGKSYNSLRLGKSLAAPVDSDKGWLRPWRWFGGVKDENPALSKKLAANV